MKNVKNFFGSIYVQLGLAFAAGALSFWAGEKAIEKFKAYRAKKP